MTHAAPKQTANKPIQLRGPEGFDAYYRSVYNARWEGLRSALSQTQKKVSLLPPTGWSEKSILGRYELDPASVVVASALAVENGESVLDMCAAPGGKSLCLIYNVTGDLDLTANDLSKERVHRLRRVIRDHVPEDVMPRIRTTCHDAARWGLFEPEHYDRVLLDAPCSGEHHLLENVTELSRWNIKRSEGLGKRQYALLCAGVMALKAGGRLVYSTCTLSPIENDDVIRRFLKRKGNATVISSSVIDVARNSAKNISSIGEAIGNMKLEPTEFGYQILPDQSHGAGPMYFCVVEKNRD